MTADALFQPGWFGPVECPRVRTGRTAQFVAKRALDYGGAVLGLLMLGLTMLAIALAIRLDSGGPVLFRQRRLGLHGKPFWIWKFRTMVVDAEARMSEMEAFNADFHGGKVPHNSKAIGSVLSKNPMTPDRTV
jgi:lipopolysaccharide/colanic/teichoic acid biosynthesis glycosyltransferase